jgi:hypothetical protein
MIEATNERSLSAIALAIRLDWKKVNYAAKPYLDAMTCLGTMGDKYGYDGADSIVIYFLGNAQTWKGEKAKAIKLELKNMLKAYSARQKGR